MLRDTEDGRYPARPAEAIGQADLAAQPGGAERGLRQYAPGASDRDVHQEDERRQARPAGRSRRRGGSSRPQARSSSSTTSSRSPAPSRRRSRKRRPTTGRIRLYRPARAVRVRACRRSITSRRPIRLARGRCRQAFVPGKADLLFTTVHEVMARPLRPVPPRQPLALALRPGVRRLCLCRRLGALCRGDDVGCRARQRRSRDPYRPALQRAAARLPLPLGDRHARQADDAGAIAAMFASNAIRTRAMPEQQAARGTYDPAYLNYTMGKLMIRKLRDDWTATRGGRKRVEGVPRPLPHLRRPADPAGAPGDDGRATREGGVLNRPSPPRKRGSRCNFCEIREVGFPLSRGMTFVYCSADGQAQVAIRLPGMRVGPAAAGRASAPTAPSGTRSSRKRRRCRASSPRSTICRAAGG